MAESARRTRRRSKQELPLKARLQIAARQCQEAALAERCDKQRDFLLQAARRYQLTADLDEWLSSPGLQPPA